MILFLISSKPDLLYRLIARFEKIFFVYWISLSINCRNSFLYLSVIIICKSNNFFISILLLLTSFVGGLLYSLMLYLPLILLEIKQVFQVSEIWILLFRNNCKLDQKRILWIENSTYYYHLLLHILLKFFPFIINWINHHINSINFNDFFLFLFCSCLLKLFDKIKLVNIVVEL